jgi:hypothetical protein
MLIPKLLLITLFLTSYVNIYVKFNKKKKKKKSSLRTTGHQLPKMYVAFFFFKVHLSKLSQKTIKKQKTPPNVSPENGIYFYLISSLYQS